MTQNERATSWNSRGFEELLADLDRKERAPKIDFEVVIVGSGYGGAIAAAELAGCRDRNGSEIKVCVLERGKEYLPGMFPSRFADLPGFVRFSTPTSPQPRGELEGLFDFRIGPDISALVASGLGGGSLINAGVMAEPKDEVFDARWPRAIRNPGVRNPFFDEAKRRLGATKNGLPNTIEDHPRHRAPKPPLKKFEALRRMANGRPFKATPITVAMTRGKNGSGVTLDECTLCGDCATGCNHNAKDSLDSNLLAEARYRGAKIYTGATVLRLKRVDYLNAWALDVVHTDSQMRSRQGGPFRLFAKKVILAAGAYGSTEILLRSQTETLKFSPKLGQQFSANGDAIAVGYDQGVDVNAVADETDPYLDRDVGPTITGLFDLRKRSGGFAIEEFSIPGPVRRLFEEAFTTAHVLHDLESPDGTEHTTCGAVRDPCAVNGAAIRRSSIFGVMGDDGAKGAIELIGGHAETEGDGAVRVRWPGLRGEKLFTRQIKILTRLVKHTIRGEILPNPLWQLLPGKIQGLLGLGLGMPFTVHPLGGCAMGDDSKTGVVNDLGEVFDCSQHLSGGKPDYTRLMPGLVVLDGSIVPCSLAINPALTISMLALRAMRGLRQSGKWSLTNPAIGAVPDDRPRFRDPPEPKPARQTEVDIVERMSGPIQLWYPDGKTDHFVAEVTLYFRTFPLENLMLGRRRRPAAAALRVPLLRRLIVDERQSQLRIFKEIDWKQWRLRGFPETWAEENGDKRVVADIVVNQQKLHLRGHMNFFPRAASSEKGRRCRALRAWIPNRGARDLLQMAVEWFHDGGLWQFLKGGKNPVSFLHTWWLTMTSLATRAGEERRMVYELEVLPPSVSNPADAAVSPYGVIHGHKRFTYGRASNPWLQLQELTLTHFKLTGFSGDAANGQVLTLDLPFLAKMGVPLMRLKRQENQPAVLADVISFGAYMLRLMLAIHLWSFRKPDANDLREPDRLPAAIKVSCLHGSLSRWSLLPRWLGRFYIPLLAWKFSPDVKEIPVDSLPDGTDVNIRLSRYPRPNSSQPPVLMIHGYSASGTTFAHHSVRPNLTEHLWDLDRDVWILDLRTSCGMPTARYPWTFEQAAFADIPAAIDYIVRSTEQTQVAGSTEQKQVDIVAHCMGAAMLSMAILGKPEPGDKYFLERTALRERIRKIALSQVGPVVAFSADNKFRAYVLNYLLNFLPLANYSFRVGPDPTVTDQIIDRILATVPYPKAEFKVENPFWKIWNYTPFVGTRHRMDALYGRTFSLAKELDGRNVQLVSNRTLASIDDLFGPLSIQTVAQVINFARLQVITNHEGRNEYVSRENLRERWVFPTLSICGEDNGLADVATISLMRNAMNDAGIPVADPINEGDVTNFSEGKHRFWTKIFKDFGHQDSLIGVNAGKVFPVISEFLNQPIGVVGNKHAQNTCVVELPSIGPILRNQPAPGSAFVGIDGAVDPGLCGCGDVILIPVKRTGNGQRYQPVLPDGTHADVRKVARQQAIATASNGWFHFSTNKAVWCEKTPGDIEGVMVLLSYRESPSTGQTQQMFLQDQKDTPESPPEIDEHVATAIENFFAANEVDDIQAGVVEIARSNPAPGGAEDHQPNESAVTFAVGSCQYPPGILDMATANASYCRLSKLLDNANAMDKPECLLLLGDQVYVDATAGLFDPTTRYARFERPYEKLYQMPSVRHIVRRLPIYMTMGDHEIRDNWEPTVDQTRVDPLMKEGRKAYFEFELRGGVPPGIPTADSPHPVWFTHEIGGFPIFMADTRTERGPRTASTVKDANILRNSQIDGLCRWLIGCQKESGDRPKFITSESILLPRRSLTANSGIATAIRSDAWDGYPDTLRRVLAFIVDEGIQNAVFMSGDEHLACVAKAVIGSATSPKTGVIHSIHSSGLYSPYPFANSIPEDLMEEDHFNFSTPTGINSSYRCSEFTRFAALGDGFAVLRVFKKNGDWHINCRFDRESSVRPSANSYLQLDIDLSDPGLYTGIR